MLIDARRLTGVGSISSYVTNTFDEHIISAVERHIRHPFSEGQVKEFLASAEDFLSIMMLSQSNFYWLRPTYPNGPQFPNYLEQAEYFSCLYNVAYELAIKEEEENGR